MSAPVENARPAPTTKRVAVFLEADDFYGLVKKVFNEKYIAFQPDMIAKEIVKVLEDRDEENTNWELVKTNVYVTHQGENDNPRWYRIWRNLTNRWRQYSSVFAHEWNLSTANVISRADNSIHSERAFSNDYAHTQLICDVMNALHEDEADVIVLITKDKSLSVLAQNIRQISYTKKRWLKVVNAFPYVKPENGATNSFHVGIDKTDWLHIDRAFYDRCVEDNGPDSSNDVE